MNEGISTGLLLLTMIVSIWLWEKWKEARAEANTVILRMQGREPSRREVVGTLFKMLKRDFRQKTCRHEFDNLYGYECSKCGYRKPELYE